MTIRMVGSPTVVSINGSTAVSDPILVAGQRTTVTAEVPATLGLIQGSMDLRNWITATSLVDGTTALSTLADASVNEIFQRFKWIRLAVTTDTSAPRNFHFMVHTYSEE